MDQTKFDVHQPISVVVGNLMMKEALWAQKGQQFTISLMANLSSKEVVPIDIYVDRTPEGTRSLLYKTVDQTQLIGATASIDPNGERFKIELIIERSEDPTVATPYVRVSPKMLALLQERQSRRMDEAISRIIEESK